MTFTDFPRRFLKISLVPFLLFILILFIPSPRQQVGKSFVLPLRPTENNVMLDVFPSVLTQSVRANGSHLNLNFSFRLDSSLKSQFVAVKSAIAISEQRSQFDIIRASFSSDGLQAGSLLMTISISSGERSFSRIGADLLSVVPSDDGVISISFNQNRSISASLNDSVIFTHRWSKPVGQTQYSSFLETNLSPERILSSHLSSVDGFSKLGKLFVLSKIAAYFLLVALITSRLGPYLKSLLLPQGIPVSTRSTLLKILSSAVFITAASVALSSLWGSGSLYFARNGVQLSSYAQFSDFWELLKISGASNPYSNLHSNYPPLAIAIFSLLRPRTDSLLFIFFLTIIPTIFLSIAYVLIGKIDGIRSFLSYCFLTICCYPLIFALDRGNTDLLISSGFIVLVVFLLNGRLKWFAFTMGFLIAFKIYPIFFSLFLVRNKKPFVQITIITTSGLLFTLLAATSLPEAGVAEIRLFATELTAQGSLLNSQPFLASFNSSISSWWHAIGYMIYGDVGIPRALTPVLQTSTSLLKALILLCSLVWASMRSRPLSIIFLVALEGMLLVTDLSFDYRLALFIPAILILTVDRSNGKISEKLFGSGLLISSFFLTSHSFYFFQDSPLSVGHLLNMPLLMTSLFFLMRSTAVGRRGDAKELIN